MRDEVRRLRSELARQDAYSFVTNTATTPRIAPHIHSQCWVDWLPAGQVNRRAYEQEKRDFGLDFVGKVDDVALNCPKHEAVDALYRRTNELLTIAEWWKTSVAYGNYILKVWCEDIAAASLGIYAANPKCDIAKAADFEARLDNERGKEMEALFREMRSDINRHAHFGNVPRRLHLLSFTATEMAKRDSSKR